VINVQIAKLRLATHFPSSGVGSCSFAADWRVARDNRAMTAAATTIFPARRVITMGSTTPDATAVSISGDRIVAVGSFDELRERSGAVVDDTFADSVVCPGFIDQHLHPILGATTLVTEVIAPEDWVLPGRTFPAAPSEETYRQALRNADQARDESRSWLFS
jgi:imidazolonepropionase-like amidohydrolase